MDKATPAAAAVAAAVMLIGTILVLPSSAPMPAPATAAAAAAARIVTPAAACRQAAVPGLTVGRTTPTTNDRWVAYLQCLIDNNVGDDFFSRQDGDVRYRTLAGMLWLQAGTEDPLGDVIGPTAPPRRHRIAAR
jgi:hypothetical protein